MNQFDPIEVEGQGKGGYIIWAYFWKIINSILNKIDNLPSGGVKNNVASTTPTVNDDSSQGYAIFSRWLNNADPNNPIMYECTDATIGNAVWNPIAYNN